MAPALVLAYHRLLDHFGPQHWWPGDSPFEIMVGAVLVQNTSWKNVEKAIGNLKQADVLSPRALHELAFEELEELIRPAGTFRVKARRLKNLLDRLFDEFDGSLEALFALDADSLRERLLSIHGIGPETADSILLYAAGKPVFVVDAYTKRVLARHAWIEMEAGYDRLTERFEEDMEPEARTCNEYHALLVRLGKEYCRKVPQCRGCPLEPLLPEGGPLGEE
jgi:endonuclease-3 related protein